MKITTLALRGAYQRVGFDQFLKQSLFADAVYSGCAVTTSESMCRILVRTVPCLSPNIGLRNSILLPFAKTVCVSVRKNSIDDIER